jgi:hypothetical protein
MFTYKPEVVRDQQHPEVTRLREIFEQRKYACLCGCVETTRWFVGDENIGITSQCRREKRALTLPATQLRRIRIQTRLRVVDPNFF